jgi:hypothetical protein
MAMYSRIDTEAMVQAALMTISQTVCPLLTFGTDKKAAMIELAPIQSV